MWRVGDTDHNTFWEHKDWEGELEVFTAGFVALISKEFTRRSSRDMVLMGM